MEQQISQTLWLPPGTCVLNALPQYAHNQPTSAVTPFQQITPQLVKQHQQHVFPSAVSPTNILPNQAILQQSPLLPSTQGYIHIPQYESVLVTPNGKQIFEIPYHSTNLIPGLSLPLTNTTILSADIPKQQRYTSGPKILKKKRISPSAKRRSRMRLIAFLEAKKKQKELEESTSDNLSPTLISDHAKIEEESSNISANDEECGNIEPNAE